MQKRRIAKRVIPMMIEEIKDIFPLFLFFIAVLTLRYGKVHPEIRQKCEFIFLFLSTVSIILVAVISAGYLRVIALIGVGIFILLTLAWAFQRVKLIH